MRYQNNVQGRADVVNAVNRWYGYARNLTLVNTSAWLQLIGGIVRYNCGGIHSPLGHGYGVDYVDEDLYTWLDANMAAQLPNFTMEHFPQYRLTGDVGVDGHYQYFQVYYNITRMALNNHAIAAGTAPNIPGGNYNVLLNFHLYVGPRQENLYYRPQPPPDKKSQQPYVGPGQDPGGWPTLVH